MNTQLSSGQQALRQEYRDFAANAVAPYAAKLVRHEICLKEFLQSLAARGYLGISVPKEYGGKGGGLLEFLFFVEAVCQDDPGLGLTLSSYAAVTEVIKRYGSPTQKSRYLPLLSRLECMATFAFAEEFAGTDFKAVKTVVKTSPEKNAGGQQNLTISGSKLNVVSGELANLFLTLCSTGDSGELAACLVDTAPGATFKAGKNKILLGLRSAYINDVDFENHNFAADNKIDGKADQIALYAYAVAGVVLSAAAVGLIEAGCQMAVTHGQKRQQFGANLGHFQGVQWKLADMKTEMESARLMTYRAGWSHDENPSDFLRHAAMSKWFACRAAKTHSGEALQIMGTHGLSAEHPLARFYGDAKTMEIAQGTQEFHKMNLITELQI